MTDAAAPGTRSRDAPAVDAARPRPDDALRVALEPVAARVRAGPAASVRFREGDRGRARSEGRDDGAPPPSRPSLPRVPVRDLVLVVVLLAWSTATGELGLPLLCAAAVLLGEAAGRLARGVPYGFGDGFVGFRSEMGWPAGVQEDDDFRWSWPTDRSRQPQAPREQGDGGNGRPLRRALAAPGWPARQGQH